MDYVDIAGSVANVAGGAILFAYGLPQPSFDAGGGITVDDSFRFEDGETLGEKKANEAHRRNLYAIRARIGFGLILLGFALQLTSALRA